tara:strand:+ start:977 stop:1438 length:462 start_codon:yes stop_codon:yes gene_type:complete
MILGARKLVGIILLLTIVSCGIKKKTTKKTQIETVTKIVTKTIKTDSSIFYLNISELRIISLDSTKPIVIKDFKGNKTTFYNVKEINTKEDKSVLKMAKKDSIVQTATVGTTIKVEEKTKMKQPIKINYWLIGLFVVIYLIIRQFFKSFFIWK